MRFNAKTDGQLKMWINGTYGTYYATNYSNSPIVQVTDGKTNPIGTSSSSINVASVDHYYYFEIIYISTRANGFYSVSLEMEGSTLDGAPSYEVQSVKLQAQTQVKERVVFVQTAATGGNFNFQLERTNNGSIVYFKNVTTTHSPTTAQFLNLLNNFDIYAPYSPAVTLVVKDNAGTVVAAGASDAHTYTYTVEFSKFRPSDVRSQTVTISSTGLTTTITGATPTMAIDSAQARAPSTPLGGTFKLSLSGR